MLLRRFATKSLWKWLDAGAENVVDGTSEILRGTGHLVRETTKFGEDVSKSLIKGSSGAVKSTLPRTNLKLPTAVVHSAKSAQELVDGASGLVKSGQRTVEDAGHFIGSASVDALKTVLTSLQQQNASKNTENTIAGSRFLGSLGRLVGTGFNELGSTSHAVTGAFTSVASSALDAGVDVIDHVAGRDAASAAAAVVGIKKSYLEALSGFTSLMDSKKLGKKLLKSAGTKARAEAKDLLLQAAHNDDAVLFDRNDHYSVFSPNHSGHSFTFGDAEFLSVQEFVDAQGPKSVPEQRAAFEIGYSALFSQNSDLQAILCGTGHKYIGEKQELNRLVESVDNFEIINFSEILSRIRSNLCKK